MTWSGRDALLAEFRPLFYDRQLLLDSLAEYVRTSRVLDDRRAHVWLEQDLLRDQELAAIATDDAERLAPRPSLYALGTCYHCAGRGYVRLDLDVGHPDFGKAQRCPACSTTRNDPAEHCEKCRLFSLDPTLPEPRYRCCKCAQLQDESAGETCTNPKWHTPNWTTGNYPAARAVPGWRALAEPLPAEDDDKTHEHFVAWWNASLAKRLGDR